jgi:hypothetical protein
MHHAMLTVTRTVLLVVLVSGCAGSKPSPSVSPAAAPAAVVPIEPGASPSDVPLNVDEGQLSPERRAAFDKLSGPSRLTAAVREEMARQGRVPAPPVQLQLVITNFRIRSTATSVWFGAMAGADMLDVETTAVKDNQVLKQWKTGSGSVVGGLIRPGVEGRFERLIGTTAERIVAGL